MADVVALTGATAADFRAANVEGVARLATVAAEQAGRVHAILVSSVAARHPELSPYAASKRAGEQAPAGSGARCMARGIAPVLGSRSSRFSLLMLEARRLV